MEEHLFIFTGSVTDKFNRVVARGTWKTRAISHVKAVSNVKYRINGELGKRADNKLNLDGTWREEP